MSVIPSLPFFPVLLPICPWFTLRMYGSGLLSIPSFSFFLYYLSYCSVPSYAHCVTILKQLWVKYRCLLSNFECIIVKKSPDQRIHQPSNSSIITHGVTWISFTSSNSIRSSLRAEANYSPTSTTISCIIMDMHIYKGVPRWFSGKEPAY